MTVITIKKDHLYKFLDQLYYVAEWENEGVMVEIFYKSRTISYLYEDSYFKNDCCLLSLEEFEQYRKDHKLKLKDLGTLLESNFEFQHQYGFGNNCDQVFIDLKSKQLGCVGWFYNLYDEVERKKLGILKKFVKDNYVDHENEIWSCFDPICSKDIKLFDTLHT